MPRDAYVRLTPQGPRSYGTAEPYRSLVFVDLHHDDIDELRQVPQGVIDRPAVVLVRCEGPADGPRDGGGCPEHKPRLEELEPIRKRLHLDCPVGLVCQPIGADPRIEAIGGDLSEREIEDLLARARGVELRALLEWGHGVWRPTDYHYRLPSGEHAASFVRMADAIRQPRDAHVLASWLRRHLRDNLAIVCDTGTLSAVIEALNASAFAAGVRLGDSAVLERYPASSLDVSQAVQDVVIEETELVLGLISVNSSGQVASWLHRALSMVGGAVRDWALEVMVDREFHDVQQVSSWLPLRNEGEDERLLDRRLSDADLCKLCENPQTARLIPINPTSFDGMLPGQVRQLMPSITDAQRNAQLWEHCSKAGAIGLIEQADDAVKDFRPVPQHMPVHFRLGKLLADETYRSGVVERVEALVTEQQKPESDLRDGQALSGNADLVLVPEHETLHENKKGELTYPRLWDEIGAKIAAENVRYTPFPVDLPSEEDWPEDVLEAIDGASDILIFALGLVTGGSLTRALTRVQARRKEKAEEGSLRREDFVVRALVVHARPERLREWESLENSFNGSLFSVWHSLVTNRQPLEEEADVLKDADPEKLSAEAGDFHSLREAFCSGDGREQTGMLWGAHSENEAEAGPEAAAEDKLSPHSLFGERLNGISTFLAVGASMERARQEARERAAPEMRVFELSALTMSYYDPMILGAVFRWLRPYEAWWGKRPEEAQTVMEWILTRAEGRTDHLRIIVPELLLAVAQGKVPDRAATVVERKAEALLADAGFDPLGRAALELGLQAVKTRKRKWPLLSPEFK